jgi:hypothetical protein
MLLTIMCVIFSVKVTGQFKIIGNGNVGINTSTPAYKFDLNSKESRFFYADRNSLFINHFGNDPRLCSDNKVVFYKSDGSGFANIECQVCTQQADINLNENMRSLENKGLPTIEKLSGISFTLKNDKTKRIQIGLAAQAVEQVIPEAVFSNDSTKIKSLAYSAIIPYLVEAIKEQQSLIQDLQLELKSLKDQLVENNTISSALFEENHDASIKMASLDQNIPNPFSDKTRIGCYIPEQSKSSILYNYSINGTKLQEFNLEGKGKQFVTINGDSFNPGTYLYKLVIDGKEVDTRKMILRK